MRSIKEWLNNEQLQSTYSSGYWNDVEEEKKKAWWILGDDKKYSPFLIEKMK